MPLYSIINFVLKIPHFCEEVNFNSAQFNAIVDFEDVAFDKEVNFSNAIFNDEVIFEEVYFDGELYFCKTIFNKKTTFLSGSFNSVEFEEALFYDIIEFINVSFNNDVYCKKGKIYNYISIDFPRINNSNIEFDNIVFKDIISGLYIKNNTGINKISIINSVINGRIDIQNVNVNIADFRGSVINGGAINPVNFKVKNFANRESALFLKNEAYARNNIIDALEHKAKEIELHKKELLKNKKDYKKWGDIFSIYLSSLYSDNGLNWIKSIFMTILITFIFFNIFYIPDLSQTNIRPCYYKYYFSSLIKYFIPTDYEQIKCYVDTSVRVNILIKIFGVIIYFAGKIMFWYGSVQTVQSFRKFSKKE